MSNTATWWIRRDLIRQTDPISDIAIGKSIQQLEAFFDRMLAALWPRKPK